VSAHGRPPSALPERDRRGGGQTSAPTARVWDRPVRWLHWTLAGAVGAGWSTTLAFGGWHRAAGCLALAAVVLRVAWSGVGSRHARFTSFVRSPRATWTYLRLLLRGREPRYLGHNPLGGWMIVALMGCVGALAFSGWLYGTDAFWGDETVEAVHRAFAWALLALAALHVAGVLFTGRRQHENLVRAMIDGDKRAPGSGDVV